MRKIKFKAWMPDIEIMLHDIAIYSDSDIGIDYESFQKILPKEYYIDWDFLYEGCIFKNFINKDGDEDFEKVLSFLPGDDWLQFTSNDIIILQYTGLKDKNGKEIYEGDIVKVSNDPYVITVCKFDNGCYILEDSADGHWTRQLHHQPERLKVIGNIYQNPDLL